MTQRDIVKAVFANGVDINAPVKEVVQAAKTHHKRKISPNVVSTVRQELIRGELITHENPEADQVSKKELLLIKQTALACGGVGRMEKLINLLKELTA